jgi:hypothetical protein
MCLQYAFCINDRGLGDVIWPCANAHYCSLCVNPTIVESQCHEWTPANLHGHGVFAYMLVDHMD